MKSAGKARNNGLYRHIRTSKEIIRNLLNDFYNNNNIRAVTTVILSWDYATCARNSGSDNYNITFMQNRLGEAI